ncbi:MAG: RrF2 family transcriptional regulator [bacterium]
MHLTSRTLYGIRTLVEMTRRGADRYHHSRDLAEGLNISRDYLNRILGNLRDEGIITVKKGPRGGYKLNHPPEEISLYVIIDTLEQPAFLSACTVPDRTKCEILEECPTQEVLTEVARRMQKFLKTISIADIYKKSVEGQIND